MTSCRPTNCTSMAGPIQPPIWKSARYVCMRDFCEDIHVARQCLTFLFHWKNSGLINSAQMIGSLVVRTLDCVPFFRALMLLIFCRACPSHHTALTYLDEERRFSLVLSSCWAVSGRTYTFRALSRSRADNILVKPHQARSPGSLEQEFSVRRRPSAALFN